MANAQMQGTDLLLVQRSQQSYSVSYTELVAGLGLDLDTGDLVVDGDLTVDGNLVLGEPGSSCAKSLVIHNATTINCNLDVTGDSTVGGTLGVTGKLSGTTAELSSTLDVTGATALASTLAVTAASTLNGGLTVVGGTETDTLLVTSTSALNGATSIDATLAVSGDATLSSKLAVTDDATFSANVEVVGTTTSGGQLTVNDNAVISGSATANSVVSTTTVEAGTSLTVGTTADITGVTSIGGNVVVNTDKAVITASTGDASFAGTVTAAFFAGDGSQLTNLNIPGSLRFVGSIDCTSDAPDGSETAGDFYLNTGTGTIVASWPDITGQAIVEGDFVYLGSDAKWSIGGGNDDGLVTLSTAQVVTGGKTFSAPVVTTGGVDATGANVTAATLTLTGKGTSDDTVDADPASTLVTKGYVDTANDKAHTEYKLKADGTKYLIGDDFDGSVERTWEVKASVSSEASKLVARDASQKIFVADIAASDIGAASATLSGALSALSTSATTTTTTGATTTNSLAVTTSATVGTTLDVNGAATLDSLGVTNAATVGGTLGVTGKTTGTEAEFTTSVASPEISGTNCTLTGKLTAVIFDLDSLPSLP